MPEGRLDASIEPSLTLRIPRGCTIPGCGAVYYIAHIADIAFCPVCSSTRGDYRLSA